MHIVSINLNGMFYRKRQELCIEWLSEQNADVYLLQETHIRQSALPIANYQVFCSPSVGKRNRGTAILLHERIVNHVVHSDTPMHGRSTMVRFIDHNYTSWEIWSIYGPYKSGERSKFYAWLPINPYKANYLVVGGDIGLYNIEQVSKDTARKLSTRVRKCQALENLIHKLDLEDVWNYREDDDPGYTWFHAEESIRLDKIFVQTKLLRTFDLTNIDNRDCELSDHRAIEVALVLRKKVVNATKKRRFNALYEPWTTQ